jgi:hypothetical protein
LVGGVGFALRQFAHAYEFRRSDGMGLSKGQSLVSRQLYNWSALNILCREDLGPTLLAPISNSRSSADFDVGRSAGFDAGAHECAAPETTSAATMAEERVDRDAVSR